MEYSIKLHEAQDHQHAHCPEITEDESLPLRSVLDALCQMRNGKSPGTGNIPAEFWKVSGEEDVDILWFLCTLIWKSEEWLMTDVDQLSLFQYQKRVT